MLAPNLREEIFFPVIQCFNRGVLQLLHRTPSKLDVSARKPNNNQSWTTNRAKLWMICALLALRPISHITKKTLSYLHFTKIEQMTKTMVIFKRGVIFPCCIRCDPIPPQTSVQRLAHTRNVTTCCSKRLAQGTTRTHYGASATTTITTATRVTKQQ